MAVVKSPKNTKRKSLWIKKNSAQSYRTVTTSRNAYELNTQANVGWHKISRKDEVKDSLKQLLKDFNIGKF